jgi:biopolymer transport protein ExbB
MLESIFHLLVRLGSEWVLLLLIGLSVIILGIAIERGKLLVHYDKRSKSFWNEFTLEWLKNGVPKNWASVIDNLPDSAELRLINLLKKHPTACSEDLAHLSEALIQSQKIEFDKNLSFLGTMGNNAPYIGLMGTVIGIIRAFASLASQSNSASSTLNASLAEALVATAVGISVALEAVILYNYFSRKSKNILERVQTLSNLIIGGVKNGKT